MREDKKHIVRNLLKDISEKNCEASFRELFNIFYHRLLNFCMQYVGDRGTAEEIVSDVFTRFWQRRNQAGHIDNPETYLFISVKNQSYNYLKKFSKFRIVNLDDPGRSELIYAHDPQKELEKRELFFRIDQAISTLPQQCKIIFTLIKEDGLKYKEVAEILGISSRTVETQLVRALKKIDKAISPFVDADRRKPALKKTTKIISFVFLLFFLVCCK